VMCYHVLSILYEAGLYGTRAFASHVLCVRDTNDELSLNILKPKRLFIVPCSNTREKRLDWPRPEATTWLHTNKNSLETRRSCVVLQAAPVSYV
jgi:hypothetical protein